MKVIIVINVLSRGGAERVVCRLTEEWEKRHDVRIAVFDSTKPVFNYGGHLVDLRVPARTLLGKVYRLVVGAFRLAAVFRTHRPDRIISFMEGANFPSILGAVMSGYLNRLWVSVRINPARITIPYLVLMPLLYRLAQRIVAPSEGVRDSLVRIGLPSSKVLVIRNPVVVREAYRESQPPVPFPFILGAGRLYRQKGFDQLLKAFHRIDTAIHLVILGEGPERDRLIGVARDLGIVTRVHFPGASSDIERWFHYALCFVLSSRYEGWPNVLMEAMAHGCPVVSFDCRYGPSEIIEDGVSGLLVAQNDVDGLRSAIMRVLTDVELRHQLGRDGRTRGKLFSIDGIASLWLTEER